MVFFWPTNARKLPFASLCEKQLFKGNSKPIKILRDSISRDISDGQNDADAIMKLP